MKIKGIIIALTSTFAISTVVGCSAILKDPVYDSVMLRPETKDLEDEYQSYQIGWLAQALLEPNARNQVAQKLFENAPKIYKEKMSAVDASQTAQMITDLAVGDLGSGLGETVGSAVFIGAAALSMLSGDGSQNSTSAILLPKEYKGKILNSADEAKYAAESIIIENYKIASEKLGYIFQCEHSCEHFPSVYRMQRKKENFNSSYIYASSDIAIYFKNFEMISDEKTKVVDSLAAGFEVEWRSKLDTSAKVLW